jgi:hypothetical protein
MNPMDLLLLGAVASGLPDGSGLCLTVHLLGIHLGMCDYSSQIVREFLFGFELYVRLGLVQCSVSKGSYGLRHHH